MLVCRSDVICEFPLREMLAFHKKTGAEGTILVTQVRPALLPATRMAKPPDHLQCTLHPPSGQLLT